MENMQFHEKHFNMEVTAVVQQPRRYTDFSIDVILRADHTKAKSKYCDATETKGPTKHDGTGSWKLTLETVHADGAPTPGLPAWLFCTRYSDRPSAGPKMKKTSPRKSRDKKSRQVFGGGELTILADEFRSCAYLTEERRAALSQRLGLSETQVKTWFQNKRANLKRMSGSQGDKSALVQMLSEEGLYNHATCTS